MKKALITGANKGIGFETARQLLQKGFYVYLGSRDIENGQAAAQQLKPEGLTNVEVIQIDVTNEDSVKAAREAVGRRADMLDALINNAGINGEVHIPRWRLVRTSLRRRSTPMSSAWRE